ncbi:Fanconi anemia group F protein [Poecile atricapillus]|uniref:Fanconi anemia group F protein n=1 Tax=Poecile atricapillus TaxID=48891 RepID=UPI0027393787|nr:Fanconi anemia group F protein [Poecile atricapillus]
MEVVKGQVEQLPVLLAVSRSALVRDWDSLTLDRALEWTRYFQHLYDRFRARPQLWKALTRRLRRSQAYPLLSFPTLGRCTQLLGLALLENRALPPAACRRLLRNLLQPPSAGTRPDPGFPEVLVRRKAAACLLALYRRPSRSPPGPEPQLQAEAQLLLSRLREEGQEVGEAAGQLHWLCSVLEQLPQPRAFEVVAAALALLKQGRGTEQAGDRDRDGSSSPDGYQGRWVKSCLDKAELSWEELRERFICLCQGSTLLKEETQAALQLLRTQDGDFKVCGLSVWTDLLMEVGY